MSMTTWVCNWMTPYIFNWISSCATVQTGQPYRTNTCEPERASHACNSKYMHVTT